MKLFNDEQHIQMENKGTENLKKWYKDHPKLLVAFSGGADSCLAAYLGRLYLGKDNLVAVISTSPSLKRRDLKIARKFASAYDIRLHEILTEEMDNPSYLSNPTNRCYFCKNTLYDHLNRIKQEKFSDFEIINGSNKDDLGDYRPGMIAAEEHHVLSPFVECGISKKEIRNMSKQFDLFTWDKPASPCLSSRFPYGESINPVRLKQVEDAEDFIMSLGFKNVRVRHFGNMAKIEVPTEEIGALKKHTKALNNAFESLNFDSFSIDEEGFVSGKLNRQIK